MSDAGEFPSSVGKLPADAPWWLAAVVNSSEDAIIGLNLAGFIVSWNRGAERIYGWPRDEAIGRHVSELQVPTERSHEPVAFLQHISEGRQVERFETERQRKDGSRVTVSVSVSPVLNARGDIIGASTIARDMSEHRELEAQLAAIVESSQDAIVARRLDGTVTSWNRAAEVMSGYTAEEAIGTKMEQLEPPERRGELERVIERLADGVASVARFETRRARRDGTQFDVWLTVSPLRDTFGEITGVSVIGHDITARKQDEAAFLQSQKLESLGMLAGGIAHDFNNLLVGILGNAGLALSELPADSPVRSTLHDIELAAQRAADLARQMLAYSGRGRLVIERVDLNALVEEMTQLLRASIGRRVNLRYNLRSNLPAVEADATQLRQVLMNLVVNGSDAIGDREGTITITTGVMHAGRDYLRHLVLAEHLPEGDYAYFEVSDTGVGMDAETQARIFDPFYSTKASGRGLGLAAVLGIARGHRGALKVYSEANRGTTFKVLIPASHEGIGAEAEPDVESQPQRGAGTVIIIDDDEMVRNVTARALEMWGFAAVKAADGAEGVAKLREHDEAVLALLDLTMPGMNGEETFSALRAVKPDLRVILMSGYNEQETTERFAGKALSGFIQKPYQLNELKDVVFRALEG